MSVKARFSIRSERHRPRHKFGVFMVYALLQILHVVFGLFFALSLC